MADVLFRGETIRTEDSLPPWALVEFGAVAASEVEIQSAKGMRTLFDLFEVLVAAQDWPRFRKAAMRATEDELVDFIKDVGAGLKAAKTVVEPPSPEPVEPPVSDPMWN